MATVSERKTLTDTLRAKSQFIIDPVVDVLAKIGVTPNMLTLLGLVMHIPVALLLVQGRWRAAVLVGCFSMLDAFDGALARKLNVVQRAGGFGAFLDSTSDRIAETILFGGFIYYYASHDSPLLTLAAFVALAGSLLVSYTRARAEALGYSCKVGFFSRVERYATLLVCGLIVRPDLAVIVLAFGTSFTVLQRMLHVWQQARLRT